MKKVLIGQKIPEEAINILIGAAEIVTSQEGNMDEFKGLLRDSTAVILGSSIKFTDDLMDLAPELKVISRTGAGVDNVDVKSATARGILVLNTPEANSISVAEHAVAMIAAISKQLFFLDQEVRKGNFKEARRMYLPVDIDGKTLGLIGCGRIGKLVARKCINAFNMKILGYDPCLNTAPENIELVSGIEEVFKKADYISLHLPLTEKTRNLIGERLLSLMKPGACLINVARGGIVDEEALARKLINKEIAGAAFDVFSSEPPEAANKLLGLSNIILTPHSAALTRECVIRVAVEAATGVVDYLKGETPRFVFNEELLNKIKS